MANFLRIPPVFLILILAAGTILPLNCWLSTKLDRATVDITTPATAPAALPQAEEKTRPGIPVIDPATDLLAPVERTISPQKLLQTRSSPNHPEQKEYEMPQGGAILTQ